MTSKGEKTIKALIIREPWIGLILAGRKDWEMRSRPTLIRGTIGLIRQGTGLVVATADLADCLEPLDAASFAAARDRHAIPADRDAEVLAAGWVHPWVLRNIRPLSVPVVAGQKEGAVTWVTLSDDAARQLGGAPTAETVQSSRPPMPKEALPPRAAPIAAATDNSHLAAFHEALCRHPRLRHVSDTKYIASFVTVPGHAIALDLSAGRRRPIWVEAHRVPPGALADIAQEGYGPERGRNSNLHKLPGFKDGALVRFFPATVEEALRIVDAVAA